MKYKNIRERMVTSFDEISFILDWCNKVTKIVDTEKNDGSRNNLKFLSFVEDKLRYFCITTKYIGEEIDSFGNRKLTRLTYSPGDMYACTWKFDKTAKFDLVDATKDVIREFNKVKNEDGSLFVNDIIQNETYKNYRLNKTKDGKIQQSAKPILGYNEKYDNTEHEVYIYDLNSAYTNILVNFPFIDTYHPHFFSTISENQVGFMVNDSLLLLDSSYKGRVEVVFDLMPSPYIEYCKKWYSIKKKSKSGSIEKKKAKAALNIPIGNWQNHNPFARAYVVNMCNKIIEQILYKNFNNICMWNTDAIYSVKPLEDLNIGDDIGQFKLEYHGQFRQKGLNYQKQNADGTWESFYRGVCKGEIKESFNILTDTLQRNVLPYYYDQKTKQIKETNNGEEL